MRTKLSVSAAARVVAPAFALGAVALLLAPAEESYGFSTLGTALNVSSERDFRIFDNFADTQSNNNLTAHASYPGWLGAEQALWKAAAEWGSRPHGDGLGDPTQTIGEGGANFDFFFGGACTGPGNGAQVVSVTPSCGGGGVFAYVSAGGNSWTMIFCDEWTWSDGPGGPSGGQIDMQGVGCHEFGHSLGLGHSSVGGATMVGSTTNGFGQRSIASDDIAGVQSIYGAADPGKPVISGVSVDMLANTITITGSNFSASGNELWFTSSFATTPVTDPRVILTGVASPSGTSIAVSLPRNAGDGDVHVRNTTAGGAGLSNGWPVDLNGASGPSIEITGATPAAVDCLIPGTDQTVTLSGNGFTANTTVTIDGVLMDPADYTFVSSTTITLDMPQVSALGSIPVRVDDGALNATSSITVVAPPDPVLQIGNGEIASLNIIPSGNGLDVIYAGPPGEFHFVLGSTSNVPSSIPIVSLCLGNNFSDLFEVTSGVIAAQGYNSLHIVLQPTFGLFYFQSLSFSQGTPLPASNCQETLITF